MNGDGSPHLSNVGSKWKRVVSFTLQPLYRTLTIFFYDLFEDGDSNDMSEWYTCYHHAFCILHTSLLFTAPWAAVLLLLPSPGWESR